MIQFNDKKQQERLEEFYLKEEEDLIKILSDKHNIPYLNLFGVPINTDALRIISEETAYEAGIAAFSITGKKLKVIIISPNKTAVKKVLDGLKRDGYTVTVFMGSKASLKKAWDLYKELSYAKKTEEGVLDLSSNDITTFAKEIKELNDLKQVIKETINDKSTRKVTKILEIVIAGAISIGASDIHIEPESKQVGLRFRIDGVLQNIAKIPHNTNKFITSRIKLLAGLKLNIKKDAQDGRFSIKFGDSEIEIRTSAIPGEYGESIVLRILNPETIKVKFSELGIEDSLYKILENEIKKPNGMILTTGPTGSGKTTTLYSFLRETYSSEIKIITIEDPIEYHLPGITQTQVEKSKGYTFLKGLRSALRQDPDIIMVGEIRDEETASVAINAALTGHLVFSTLHTNNAAGVIPRLIDLGVNPKIISSALNVSLAQRLIRTLCKKCKIKDIPTDAERKIIENILSSIKEKREVNVKEIEIWRAPKDVMKNNCLECAGVGYKGRIGIFEGILTDKNIENVIIAENPSEREIKEVAKKQKILTMREDGILKVLQGVTSIEELSRMVDLAEE